MTKYDVLYEALQEQVETGDITLETAEYLNDIAYELYSEEEIPDYDLESELISEATEYLENILTEASDVKTNEYNKLRDTEFSIERQLSDPNISNNSKKSLERELKKVKLRLKTLKPIANQIAMKTKFRSGCK